MLSYSLRIIMLSYSLMPLMTITLTTTRILSKNFGGWFFWIMFINLIIFHLPPNIKSWHCLYYFPKKFDAWLSHTYSNHNNALKNNKNNKLKHISCYSYHYNHNLSQQDQSTCKLHLIGLIWRSVFEIVGGLVALTYGPTSKLPAKLIISKYSLLLKLNQLVDLLKTFGEKQASTTAILFPPLVMSPCQCRDSLGAI